MKSTKSIKYSNSEDLELCDYSIRELLPDEVLIENQAIGVNRPDLLQCSGLYPAPKGHSEILGLESSGIIIAIGNKVTEWQIGDRVAALLNGGGYSEYSIAKSGHCLKIPNNMNFIEAAGLPEAMFTIYANVFEGCALKSGETILIHGGASSIGTIAIKMCKAIGAKVYITAGSDEKCEVCKDLGADLVVNYKTEDFETNIKANGGADIILDMIGGDYIQKNINILNQGGRLCNIAYLNGAVAEINFMRLMLKNLTITGSVLRSRQDKEKTRIRDGIIKNFWGKIEPKIDKSFPLKDAQLAMDRLKRMENIGKIILIP